MQELSLEQCADVSGGLDLGSVVVSVAICSALYYYRDAISIARDNLFKQSTHQSCSRCAARHNEALLS